MDSYWILLYEVFDDLWAVAPHSPHQQSSLFMVAYYGVFNAEGSQSAHYAYGALDLVAFDLGVGKIEGGLFFGPDGWDGGGAWFDEVAQAEETIIGGEFAPFYKDDNALHFGGGHPVDKLVLELFDVLVVLEDVEDVLMLEQFLLEITGRVAWVWELHARKGDLVVGLGQFDVDCDSLTCQDHYSYLRKLLALFFGLQPQRFTEYIEGYSMTRFSS